MELVVMHRMEGMVEMSRKQAAQPIAYILNGMLTQLEGKGRPGARLRAAGRGRPGGKGP